MGFQSLGDELKGYGTPPEKPPSRASLRVFYALAALALVGGIAFAVYKYGEIYLNLNYGGGIDAAAQAIAARAKLTDGLGGLPNITGEDILRGFWYEYTDESGHQSILYFDADALSLQGLSDAEIQALLNTIARSRILPKGAARTVAEDDLPPELRFHNELYSFGQSGRGSLDIERDLQNKVAAKSATSEDLFQLSYVAELNGNYAERDRINAQNCKQFGARCTDPLSVFVEGHVVDNEGQPVQGARVELLSRPEAGIELTDAKGMYTLRTGAKEMEKIRIRAVKRNYSDGLTDTVVLTAGKKLFEVPDIVLEAPIRIVTIDYGKKTVTGSGNAFNADGSVSIHTPQSAYEISRGAIVGADGLPYTAGPIDVYLYEFTKGNPPESLMQLDTFDQVIGYAGNLMKTFGMPYIQFFAEDGTELEVLRSKPMVLTYRIPDMDALRSNADKIYQPLTDADMQKLVAASKQSGGYPIDRQFLINNGLLRFPAFWVFDRRRGVWDNIGISVLDTSGTIRTIFYTVRDAN